MNAVDTGTGPQRRAVLAAMAARDPFAAAVALEAAERMAAHYRVVFAGMAPAALQFSTGHQLTVELSTALAAIGVKP